MPTTRRRKKISSAVVLLEDEGVGLKVPESVRNQHSPAVWEVGAQALPAQALAPAAA